MEYARLNIISSSIGDLYNHGYFMVMFVSEFTFGELASLGSGFKGWGFEGFDLVLLVS